MHAMRKHSIPDKDIEALVRYQEKEGEFPCAFVQEDEIFMNYTDKAVNDVFHLLNFPAPPIRPIEDIYGKTVYQLIAFFTAEQEKRITLDLHPRITDKIEKINL